MKANPNHFVPLSNRSYPRERQTMKIRGNWTELPWNQTTTHDQVQNFDLPSKEKVQYLLSPLSRKTKKQKRVHLPHEIPDYTQQRINQRINKQSEKERERRQLLPRMSTRGMIKWAEFVAMRWERVVEKTPGLYPTVLQLLWMNSSSCGKKHPLRPYMTWT